MFPQPKIRVGLCLSRSGLTSKIWASVVLVFTWKEMELGGFPCKLRRDSWHVLMISLHKLGLLKPQTCCSCYSSSTRILQPAVSLFRQTGYLLVRDFDRILTAPTARTTRTDACGLFWEPRLSVPRSLGIFPDEYNWPVKPAMLLSRRHQSWHLEETWEIIISSYSVFQMGNQAQSG